MSRLNVNHLAVFLAVLLIGTGQSIAAPINGMATPITQPDGSVITAYAYGDEYNVRFESKEGYTLVQDPRTGWLCYARLNWDESELTSSGIRSSAPSPADLAPHQRATEGSLNKGTSSWEGSASFTKAPKGFSPQAQAIFGVTILIDFSDKPGTIDSGALDDFMNLEGFTGFVNGRSSNGSVGDYYSDVSGGLVTYTNTTILSYFRAPQTWAYYAAAPMGAMNNLVFQALTWLDQTVGHDFSVYDADGNGEIDAINIFTAGGFTPGSALHPHTITGFSVPLDGLVATRYQNTNIGPLGPALAVVCHENGHMLFGWPDLYTASGSSAGNLSGISLMGFVFGSNPVQPDAYLKTQAGWIRPLDLKKSFTNNFLRSDVNTAAILERDIGSGKIEKYIFENRQKVGRDADIIASGIAIYRVIESASSTSIEMVEADGGYDLLDGGFVEASDMWSASTNTEFDFSTVPAATWDDGSIHMSRIYDISVSGTLMTFNHTLYEPTTLNVRAWPEPITAPWTLRGPGTFVHSGQGYEDLIVPGDISYQVDFESVPLWTTPSNSPLSQYVPSGGALTTFSGYYGSPVAPLSGAGLSNTGDTVASAVVDFDNDGDADIFVVNADGPNQLLRNDGYYSYIDVAPALLAGADARGSAWADVDGDGDQDVFLFGDTGTNLLLESSGGATPTFTDVSSQTPTLMGYGVLSSASWMDIDRDGAVDLFLTRADSTNLRLDGITATPFALVEGDAGFAGDGANSYSVHWGDLNNDGWPDMLVNASAPFQPSNCRLVMNDAGVLVHPNIVGFPWPEFSKMIDSEFGDFDGDGVQDIAAISISGSLDIYRQNDQHGFDRFNPTIGGSGYTAIETGDFDGDGDLDLYCGSSTGADIMALNDNQADYTTMTIPFTRVPIGFDGLVGQVQTVATLDATADGGLDIFVGRGGLKNSIMVNFVPNRGHWIEIDLTATTAHADAVGARIQVVVGATTLSRSVESGGDDGQSSGVVHFGLGSATSATAVIVTWSGGGTTVMTNVAADQKIQIVEVPTNKVEQDSDGSNGSKPEHVPMYATTFKSAYPNPFNPSTTIAFSLGNASHVKAVVYAIDGTRVKNLADSDLSAGDHQIVWHGTNDRGQRVASGTYFCRIAAGSRSRTLKLVLVK